MSTRRPSWYAWFLTASLLAGAFAIPAAAQEDADDAEEGSEAERPHPGARGRDRDRPDGPPGATDRSGRPDWAGKPAFTEHCTRGDASSEECKQAHREFDRRHSARAHVAKAVSALESRIAHLEVMEYKTEQRMAQGDQSSNETAQMQAKLDRIEAAQDKTIERLLAIKARWDAMTPEAAEEAADAGDGDAEPAAMDEEDGTAADGSEGDADTSSDGAPDDEA